MVVYIRDIGPISEVSMNKYSVHIGAYLMGEEVVTYQDWKQLSILTKEDIVCDYIAETRQLLKAMNIAFPTYDYPEALKEFYGRKLKQGKFSDILNNSDNLGKFIKPLAGSKMFNGKIINHMNDLIGIKMDGDYPIWISEVVEFMAEWRCFILNNQVIDVRPYKGDYHYQYDARVIDEAVAAWKNSPSAYALDIGITSQNQTLIVEVNDGYSLGQYGLSPLLAFKFHKTRWRELTNSFFAEHEQFIL